MKNIFKNLKNTYSKAKLLILQQYESFFQLHIILWLKEQQSVIKKYWFPLLFLSLIFNLIIGYLTDYWLGFISISLILVVSAIKGIPVVAKLLEDINKDFTTINEHWKVDFPRLIIVRKLSRWSILFFISYIFLFKSATLNEIYLAKIYEDFITLPVPQDLAQRGSRGGVCARREMRPKG